MESTKIIDDITNFLKYFTSKANSLQLSIQKLKKSVDIVYDQLVALSAVNEVQLPSNVIKKHPDIGKRVSNCLGNLIDDEICEINHLLYGQPLKEIIISFGKMHRKIEQGVSKIKWDEVSPFLLSSVAEITEWIEKCCKYFQLVHFNVNNAIKMFHHDVTFSSKWFKDIFKTDTEDRIQIFGHPAIDMFLLLSKEKAMI